MRQPATRLSGILGICILAAASVPAVAMWHDPAWEYRRVLQLTLSGERISGNELAHCRILLNGKQKPDASDIRILTATGRTTGHRIISIGRGDEVELVFDTVKGVRDYYLYFGNPKSPSPQDATHDAGLLLETRAWAGQPIDKIADMPSVFDASKPQIGREMLQRPYLGMNPFGPHDRTVSRLSGRVFAPLDGEYVFAVAADDRGGLYVDDKPVVFARYPAGDSRFQDRVYLKRGWHPFSLFHVNMSAEGLFGVFWRRPDMDKFEIIGRESFGLLAGVQVGPLEQVNHSLTADIVSEYKAEAFYAGNYSHRLSFALQTAFAQSDRVQCQWDFGDGQQAAGRTVEHVFLLPGVYTIKLTATAGQLVDTQTFRISVDRDWEHSDRPSSDDPGLQSRLVATYDVSRLPLEALPAAALLHLRGNDMNALDRVALRLASIAKHPSRPLAVKALEEMQRELPKRGRINHMADVWRAVPADSDLQPWATCELAEVLTWWQGDPAAALKVMQPFAEADDRAKRTWGELLVLNRRADEGRKVLESLPALVSGAKQAAVGGALARTTEFYITEDRWEDGEEAWEKWQLQIPTTFLEGHSMFLRVQLMELRKANVPAAALAEAFANSLPQSPYAPRLLDKASKLLANVEPARSKSLRDLLKQRYPEDPLSQDTPAGK